MLQKQSETASATCSYSLLSFVPRSVLLLSKPIMTSATPKLDKKILLQAIYRYLKISGFSKTVKKLKSEAQLDEDGSTDTNLLDLEEICSKHLQTLKHATEAHHKSEEGLKSNGSNEVTDAEKVSKKKKKVKSDSDDAILTESHEKSTIEPEGKSKEKKKSKKSADAADQDEIDNDTEKSKKKKKHQTLVNGNNEENASEKPQKSKKKNKQDSDVEDSPVKTNETKKRKRASTDDDGDEVDDATPIDKSKEVQPESVAKKSEVADLNHINDVTNSNNGYKSSGQKSAKKPRNGSAEPTTIKAFQRVKVDEVVIKDERLKDNSYWAKDGAESGYGAKAQEILGQVRGKDFRHEKTKKKRGSYRGGSIDFGTHSIKFNDSDDE